jgi:hypothetical protein
MTDIATPPSIATLTRDTNVPVRGLADESTSMVCDAGPTNFIGSRYRIGNAKYLIGCVGEGTAEGPEEG